MAEKQTYKILGQQGFEKYDELLRGVFAKPPDTTPEQIDELFPSKIKSFGAATDEELTTIINGYYDGTISLSDIQKAWHVGDTRDINISSIEEYEKVAKKIGKRFLKDYERSDPRIRRKRRVKGGRQ